MSSNEDSIPRPTRRRRSTSLSYWSFFICIMISNMYVSFRLPPFCKEYNKYGPGIIYTIVIDLPIYMWSLSHRRCHHPYWAKVSVVRCSVLTSRFRWQRQTYEWQVPTANVVSICCTFALGNVAPFHSK